MYAYGLRNTGDTDCQKDIDFQPNMDSTSRMEKRA